MPANLIIGAANSVVYGLIALVIGFLAAKLLVLAINHIQDKRVRAQVLALVKAAAQEIPNTTEGRKTLVERGIKVLGLPIPAALVGPYIETAVAEFKAELGEMTNTPTLPAPVPVQPAQNPTPADNTPDKTDAATPLVHVDPSTPATIPQDAVQYYIRDSAGNLVPVPAPEK